MGHRPWYQRTLTPAGQAAAMGLLALLFALATVALLARTCDRGRPEPRPVPPPVRVGLAAVAEASPAVREVDPLALAIWRVPSTGYPGPVTAAWLAGLFRLHATNDAGPWTLAALGRLESGYRPWAVEGDRGVPGAGRGPGLGLMGLHGGFLASPRSAFRPADAVALAAAKIARIVARHRVGCRGTSPHAWLVHWFCGLARGGCAAGQISARRVGRAEEELRVAGRFIR